MTKEHIKLRLAEHARSLAQDWSACTDRALLNAITRAVGALCEAQSKQRAPEQGGGQIRRLKA